MQTVGGDSIESFTAASGPVEGVHIDSEDHGLVCSCGVDSDVSALIYSADPADLRVYLADCS